MANAVARKPSSGKIIQATDTLRREILRGRRRAGAMLPTREELTTKYKLSVASMELVMSRLAEEGVVRRVPGQGSFVADPLPDGADATLKPYVGSALTTGIRPRTRFQTIDYIQAVHYQGAPIKRDRSRLWTDQLSRACYERRWAVRYHPVSEEEASDTDHLAQQFTPDDAVLVSIDHCRPLMRSLLQRGVRAAQVFGEIETNDFPQITFDRRRMGREACEYLIARGYRRIAFLGSDYITSRMRLRGFLDAVQAHRLPVPVEWLIESDEEEDGIDLRSRMRPLITAARRPCASRTRPRRRTCRT